MKIKSIIHKVFLVFLFSFLGFNLTGGLRTDHFFTYSLFIVLLIGTIVGVKISSRIFQLALFFLVAFLSVVTTDFYLNPNYRVISLVQSAENIFNPIAVFFLFAFFVTKIDKINFYKYFIYFSILVSIISIYSYLSPNSIFFDLISSGIKDQDSVRFQSLSVGRYLGVFNQPLEAGLFHGVINILITYLLIINVMEKPILIFTLIINVIAGLLSLSKTFYILSLVITLLILFIFKKKKVLSIVASFLFVIFALLFLVVRENTYIDSLVSLYDDFGFFMAITAGRFGAGGATDVGELFLRAWQNSPFIGYGLGTHLPLDNGYLEYFFQGGLFSLFPLLLFFLLQVVKSITNFDSKEGKFMFCYLVFLILANLGGPVFTTNKANILVIGLIAIQNTTYKNDER